jgi:hypothetical protein
MIPKAAARPPTRPNAHLDRGDALMGPTWPLNGSCRPWRPPHPEPDCRALDRLGLSGRGARPLRMSPRRPRQTREPDVRWPSAGDVQCTCGIVWCGAVHERAGGLRRRINEARVWAVGRRVQGAASDTGATGRTGFESQAQPTRPCRPAGSPRVIQECYIRRACLGWPPRLGGARKCPPEGGPRTGE